MIQRDTKGRSYIILIPVYRCNFNTYENKLHIGITLQSFKVNVWPTFTAELDFPFLKAVLLSKCLFLF